MNTNQYNTKYDDTNFPFVKIKFGNTIKDENEFEEFKTFLLHQYLKKTDFYLIFDTSNITSIPISYIYKLAQFIGKLKKLNDRHLKVSILLIKSILVRGLFNLYMNIQTPLSKVYIVSNEEDVDIIINKLKNNEQINEYNEYN